jgi:hypothetical protein
MNWSDITSGYGSQSFRPIGGLLGLSFGGKQSQFPQFGSMQSRFPQYGGNTRSAQMMNNYMGGLLSRRQGYMPPAMPMRQQPQPMAAAMFGNGYGTPYSPYFDMGGIGGFGEGFGAGPGGDAGVGSGAAIGGFGEGFGDGAIGGFGEGFGDGAIG